MSEALILQRRLLKLSIVVPVYNEEQVLPEFRRQLEKILQSLTCEYEIILVDDGSSDRSMPFLDLWSREDRRIKVLLLSRNFGQEAAILAGLDRVEAEAEAVIVMDADLQDPPELIVAFMEKYEQGYDLVYAQRLQREKESFFKRCTARLFYQWMHYCTNGQTPVDTGCFRLMSREVLEALLQMREVHRFFRALSSWVGFRQIAVPFDRPGRVAGQTKFTLLKMLRLSADAAFSFSTAPMRLCLALGLLMLIFGIGYAFYSVIEKYWLGNTVPGWTGLVVFQALLGGVVLCYLGIIGEYVARIYEQIKGRPNYVVKKALGFEVPNGARTSRPLRGAHHSSLPPLA